MRKNKTLTLIISIIIFPISGICAELMTSCPNNYTMISRKILIQSQSCPTDYIAIQGEETSCITYDCNGCLLYASPNHSFMDQTGNFKFVDMCEYVL